ncbi:MAG: VanW family protein [Bacillota bacterium]
MTEINAQDRKGKPGDGKPFFSKKKNILLVVLGVLALLLGGGAVWAFVDQPLSDQQTAQIMETGVFHSNIRINGVDVGGLTADQAKDKVESQNNTSAQTFALTLQLDEKQWQLTGANLEITTDIDNVLKEAMLVDKSGSNWRRLTVNNTLNGKGYDYTIKLTPDAAALEEQVNALAKEATTEPKEPSFKGLDASGKPTFEEGKTGYVVDAAALLKTVQDRFASQDFSAIQMTAQKTEPSTTAEELQKNAVLIGSFTTYYGDSSSNRKYNVGRAAGLINGVIVKPGEIFDTNATLGPRTYQLGWKAANGITGGNRYQLEAGGGVCQVATTLFNAVMEADLKIVERWNHSLKSHYVPPGRDATISTGGKNFRFENTRSGPVYVVAVATGSRLTVQLYGPPHPQGYTVKITQVTTSVIYAKHLTKLDPTKPVGYKEVDKTNASQNGCTADTYKTYYKNGKQVGERILIFHSKYNAVNYLTIVGSAPTPTPTLKPTPTPKPTTEPTTKPTATPKPTLAPTP